MLAVIYRYAYRISEPLHRRAFISETSQRVFPPDFLKTKAAGTPAAFRRLRQNFSQLIHGPALQTRHLYLGHLHHPRGALLGHSAEIPQRHNRTIMASYTAYTMPFQSVKEPNVRIRPERGFRHIRAEKRVKSGKSRGYSTPMSLTFSNSCMRTSA